MSYGSPSWQKVLSTSPPFLSPITEHSRLTPSSLSFPSGSSTKTKHCHYSSTPTSAASIPGTPPTPTATADPKRLSARRCGRLRFRGPTSSFWPSATLASTRSRSRRFRRCRSMMGRLLIGWACRGSILWMLWRIVLGAWVRILMCCRFIDWIGWRRRRRLCGMFFFCCWM